MKTRIISRHLSTSSKLTVGIRREDPARIWERRAPLTPEAVHRLVGNDVQVHVEHCDRRIFTDEQYALAGAEIRNKLVSADILLGIKEPPLKSLILNPSPNASSSSSSPVARTYMMFSHTAKGQTYNTPLLSSFLAGPHPNKDRDVVDSALPRLIDFELLTEKEGGKRTVGFGWFAGVAGVLESLSSMAHSHLESGVASPFLYTPRPHTMRSLLDLRSALRNIGCSIASDGTPKKLGPFVIGLTGTGQVSQGCLSMLSELPIVNVKVEDLPALVADENTSLNKVYLVHALPSDYLKRSDGAKYSREDYYTNPSLYRSVFCDNIAPYLTLFLNGAGWAPSYPRLMTNEQLTTALTGAQVIGGLRFTNIGDISCDPEGGLQFLTHSTTLSSPFAMYRPETLPSHLPSVQMMAVDILPSSLPLDASQHFSDKLLPYLERLIESYRDSSSSNDEISRALDRATIARRGKLVEKHAWLNANVDAWRTASAELASVSSSATAHGVLKRKKVLMLGSGMVAGPAVDKIAERSDVELIIGSNMSSEAEKLSAPYGNVQHRKVDMSNLDTVSGLVREADVVISLLPVAFHTAVAELCIQHRKHMVTASYISDSMKALHKRAIDVDILLLNEIGLDPGIDHCSAIDLISRLHAEKKKVVSFISFCGGLPSPDNMGPLGYKFSWSPRGVLTAALNSAKYRLRNKNVEVPGSDLLISAFPDVPVTKEFALEGLVNRNSFPYAGMYDIGPPHSMRTLLRGTLRYPGFGKTMQFFKEIGLLELGEKLATGLRSWADLVPQAQALRRNLHPKEPYVEDIQSHPLYETLHWLLSGSSLPPVPKGPATPLDIFANLLSKRLEYGPGEKDMVVLSHELISRSVDPAISDEEVHTSTLITLGTDRHSAMARTVGLPVAIAALTVLDGNVPVRGVAGPGDITVRNPVLSGLEEMGLGMKETVLRTASNESIESRLAAVNVA